MPLVFVCVIPHSKSNYLFLFVGSFKTIDFGLPTNTRQSVVRIQSNSCQMLFLIILMPLVSVCLIPRSKSMYISVCGIHSKVLIFGLPIPTPVTESRHNITFTVPQH